MSKIESKIGRKIGKAIYRYKMIEEGDKILVALSGGKDSTALLYDLARRQKSFPIKYHIEAIHIEKDMKCAACGHNTTQFAQEMGVKLHNIFVPIEQRLKPGKTMNCYWCSTQRRLEIMKLAEAEGFNKIALGHHMDDIVETLLMNMFYKSEISTMPPILKYDKYPITIIRPLALVKEAEIVKLMEEKGLSKKKCACPYGSVSRRLEVKNLITELSKSNKSIRENLYHSMTRIKPEYLV